MANNFYRRDEVEKEVNIKTYDSLFDVIANIPEISQAEEKSTPDFINLVAHHCNYAGIDYKTATEFICRKYDLEETIV